MGFNSIYSKMYSNMGQRILPVLFAWLVNTHAPAQAYRPFVKHIDHNDGLSYDACRSVLKDSDGFIWITTENGLNRYDGHHFVVFKNDTQDSTSILGNSVFELCEDNHRNIWISGADFISRYSMDQHRFYNYSAVLNNANTYNGNFITKIYLDNNKRLWLCGIQSGLLMYRPQSNDFERILPDPNAPTANLNSVSDIIQFDEDKYWLATNAGLLKFDLKNKSFQLCNSEPDKPENFIFYNLSMCLKIDPEMEQGVWYGTWGGGLHCYNGITDKTEVYHHTNNAPLNVSNIVFDVEMRDSISFWICTEKGLMIFDKVKHMFQFIPHETDNPNSLWSIEYQSIYTDPDGLVWIPSSKGVEMIDPLKQAFRSIVLSQKPSVYSLQWNESLKALVGTSLYANRALWIIEPISGKFERIPIPETDKKMLEPIGLHSMKDGHVLIGITRMNPYIYKPTAKKFEQINLSDMLDTEVANIDVRSMVEDKDGNIWMSNRKGGIIYWNVAANKAALIGKDNDSASVFYQKTTQHVMQRGNFVFGFVPNAGFIRISIDTHTLEYLPFENELLRKAEYAVCDANGHFWFTTPNYGLVECIADNTITMLHNYNSELPDNALGPLYADSEGMLWINSTKGLISFNINSASSSLYNEANGLYPYSTDLIVTQTNDHNYYFISAAGLGHFNTHELVQPSKYYKTVLSQFFASDVALKSEAALTDMTFVELQPYQNNISFAFSALCFSGMEKLEFAYKLEGFDSDWHYIGNSHNGSYTNLPPGKYTLWLNSKYTGIPWETNVTAIEILVKPHYYQTLWFKALVVLLLLSIVVVIIRTHFKNKLKQAQAELEKQKSIQNIRTRISRDIHDEIGAGLTKISLMSKMMEKAVGENNHAQDQIKKINNASRQLVQNLGEIVWTINPNNDSLSDLLAYLRGYMNDLAQTTDCKISLLLPEITPAVNSVALHPETKRNLLLIIKESLNNALKHSGASKIGLNITYVNGTLSVSVKDNGKGFLMNENERKGNGLRNMRKRAEDIGSVLEVDTIANEGTTVHLNLKV